MKNDVVSLKEQEERSGQEGTGAQESHPRERKDERI